MMWDMGGSERGLSQGLRKIALRFPQPAPW